MEAKKLTSFKGLPVDGPLLLSPNVFGDDRGFFFESWNQNCLNKTLKEDGQKPQIFVQDNHSRSSFGVLRGLHYQLPPHSQAKLVRCVAGNIFDIAVDLRLRSSTFCHVVGVELSSKNHQQLWIPSGFAHGFLTVSEFADVLYKTTDFWCRESERSIRWDDPTLEIKWPDIACPFSLSIKDGEASLMQDLSSKEFFG